MSYTTIKAIDPGVKHWDIEELHNSHGSAPVIWDAICQKYLGDSYAWLGRGAERLWPLWKDCTIPKHQRAVLFMTYDRVYVVKADYKRAAEDIRAFLRDFPQNPNRVNHWPRMIELFESDPDIPAIGLYCTSVSEDPFDGPWNEEKEEHDQPDWSDCHSVYEQIDSIKC
jgi:hypothetical protein